jgi:altronate dehydratase large subunit
LETVTRVLRGIAGNANVGAALIVSLGCESVRAEDIVEAVEDAKPTALIRVQKSGGVTRAVTEGTARAQEMALAVDAERVDSPLGELIVGVKCGASDTTSGLASNVAVGHAVDRVVDAGGTVIFGETTELMGAEHVIERRSATPEISREILRQIGEMEDRAKSMGVDMRGSQPTPGNMEGGLSTIEEKSLGAVVKSGTRPIVGALEYGEPPTGKGLYFMDSPGRELEFLTGLAACGCQIIMFSTGVGAVQGFSLVPVIKVTGNRNTACHLQEHIDVDVSGILRGEEALEEAGERLFAEILRVASGAEVKAERLAYDARGANSSIYVKGPVL